jgi:hypothetical protein
LCPEFTGYLSLGKQYVFILTDTRTQKASDWIAVGGGFQGATISGFDAEHEILAVTYYEQSAQLPLKGSKVVPVQPHSGPKTTSSYVEGGVELAMTLSRDGILSLNGHAMPGETLDALFTVMAREKEGLLLRIEKQFPKTGDTTDDETLLKNLMRRMAAAGLKRIAINMDHAPAEQLKEPSTGAGKR